ncbi:hypothetical protein [Marinivivus vitaminiproducens]|uniref:hypothetical protein n=1 Tax=Marinivivus vitaminiproducens TaxID=3035935 RepID=UPI00279E8BDB|nr:hypothetical protein P4R82_24925 [Geminicoccaceae bacterium SCSIO 64248]
MPYAPYHSALIIGLILIAAGTLDVERYRLIPAEGDALATAWLTVMIGFLFAMGSSTGKLIAAGPGSFMLLSLWLATVGVISMCVTADIETLTSPFYYGPLTGAILAVLTHLRSFD